MLAGMPAGALAPFTALISLNLSQSCLTQWPLPVQPGRMHQLQELILSRNRDLRSMPPPALCALPGLRTLNLSGTPAGAALLCPGSLAFASALTLLDLSNTGLAGFPPDVARLRALRTLNLSGNKIVAVPDEVGHSCQSLEELDLSNNELATLSPYLGQLTQLRSLSLDGNPLRTMRRAVLDKGTLAVLEYLRERCPL
ncbi:hypothetical protein FOA52_014198 [Chlamydomonas sp. UWO 241]|nr:hypothetical protein FOA52_014198 [Chlamydomonas sp. UWO 241]